MVWWVVLSAWEPVLVVVEHGHKNLTDAGRVVLELGLPIAGVATCAFGALLAVLHRWAFLLLNAAMGGAALLVGYGVAVLSTSASETEGADDAAAIGLMVLSVPALAVVLALLSLGGGVATLIARALRRLRSGTRGAA